MNKMLNICKNQVILRVNYILRDKKTHYAENLRSQALLLKQDQYGLRCIFFSFLIIVLNVRNAYRIAPSHTPTCNQIQLNTCLNKNLSL